MGAAPVATGGSRFARWYPPCGSMGVETRRYVALYGGACYDRTRRSSRPCYARRLNFHVRLVCAHSPNSPAGVASTPFWGGGGWGGTSASPYGLKVPLLGHISQSPLLAVASLPALQRWLALLLRVLCASLLLAAQRASASLSCFAAFISRCAARIEHRTLRCCNFNSVLLLPLPLCAGQALAAWA